MYVVYMCEYREAFFFQKFAYKKYMYVKKILQKIPIKVYSLWQPLITKKLQQFCFEVV